MNNDKIAALLGMAQKAGKIASGDAATVSAVQKGKAQLLLVACDTAVNTKEKYQNMATYYGVPYFEFATKLELGLSIGKAQRSGVVVLDRGFAKALQRLFEE